MFISGNLYGSIDSFRRVVLGVPEVADAHKTLARAAIFDGVEPATAAALRRQLHPVVFGAGQTIFAEGDPGDRIYIIKSGKVKIGRHRAGGRHYSSAVLGPSDMFGELSVFDPGPRTSSATTITKVRAVWVGRDAVRAWVAERPEIAERLLVVLSRRLRRTNDAVMDHIVTDAPGRVAMQLLLLARRFGGDDGWTVPHELTHDEIAQLAGTSREVVHQALQEFAGRGWLRPDTTNVMVILDPEGLAYRAGHRPTNTINSPWSALTLAR